MIFCSFGDMLRVPGTDRDLFRVKGEGGDVRVVYSPLDALELARRNPDREVVFFAIGFETTAPANAMAVHQARRLGLTNFSLLVSHVRVPPAIEAIMTAPACRVQGFLAAGHVCSVMGMAEYPELAERFGVPMVVTGFEPLDILEGIRRAVRQLERGEHRVENAYPRAVREEGNPAAVRMIEEVFEVTDRNWRGIGPIPLSGWRLTDAFRAYDAEHRFDVTGHPYRGARRVPQRRGAPGADQADRVRGVRHHLHPAHPARRHHGLQRGRLRGLLPVPPDERRDTAGRPGRAGGDEPRCLNNSPTPSTRPTGPVPLPCATSRSW